MTATKKTKRAPRKPKAKREPTPLSLAELNNRLEFYNLAMAVSVKRGDSPERHEWFRGKIAQLEKLKEDDMNRRQLLLDEEFKARPVTGPGMVYVADKRFRCGDAIYNRGCLVPPEQIPNFEKLVAAGYIVGRLPSSVNSAIQPVAAPAPEAPMERPELVIDGDEDPVVAWGNSLELMTAAYGGDAGRARDALVCSPKGGDLYRLAVRVDAERTAREKHLTNRRIVSASL